MAISVGEGIIGVGLREDLESAFVGEIRLRAVGLMVREGW